MIETLLAADPLYRAIIILLGSIAMVLLASLSVGEVIAAGGSTAGMDDGDADPADPDVTAEPVYDRDGCIVEFLTLDRDGGPHVRHHRVDRPRRAHPAE